MNQLFVETLNLEIASLPPDFFSTFRYTTTGNNLCHPVTLGAIARVVNRLPGVVHVGIDVRLNDGEGDKFQPDVVGYDQDFHPLLLVDFESPNSSDARVPVKDWFPFATWKRNHGAEAQYLVVTTLPEHSSPKWELRWTANRQYNESYRGQRDAIRSNPFEFWYTHYRSEAAKYDLSGINMVNIADRHARMVQLECL